MTKILYIGNYLTRSKTNKTYMFVLSELLQKEGFDVICASSKHNKAFRLLDMIWKLVVHCKSVDYVLIDTYSTINFYYALIISQFCRVLKLRYVPILHGGNLPNRLLSNPKLCDLIFKHSEVNISPSNYLIYEFKSKGYSNIKHIPNTIEIELYKNKSREINKIKLLWVRGFSEIYNPEMALNVLYNLIKTGYDAKLCMVGPDIDGSMSRLKNLAKEKNLQVHFTGKLSKLDWLKLSEESNIFINTTNIDNTPVSVIEAMALGLPVVSTNVGGLKYLIEDYKDGLLVLKENTQAMVEAIIKLKNDNSLRIKIIENARQKVEKFDWITVKDLWKSVLS